VHTSLVSAWSNWLPHLLDGLLVSVKVTGLSLVIGFSAGLVLALLLSSSSRLVRWPFVLLVEVGRGMPALVMLQLVYFGLPRAGITLNPFPATVLALSLTTAAYTSEIIRAGLRAVPAGELEAADALGLSRADAARFSRSAPWRSRSACPSCSARPTRSGPTRSATSTSCSWPGCCTWPSRSLQAVS
jgi:polar amino acid transport system permease protein